MATPPITAFAHLPADPRGHFLLHYYAAIQHLLHYLDRLQRCLGQDLEDCFNRYPFLAGYCAELQQALPETLTWEAATPWWQQAIATWEQSVTGHLPLRVASALTDTGFQGRLVLLCLGLVEEDSRFGTLFAQIQEPLPYRRPCLETIGHILGQGRPGGVDAWSLCRPWLQAGLLEVTNRAAPRAEWVTRIPPLLWDVLRGTSPAAPTSWCRLHPPASFPALDHLLLPASDRHRLAQLPSLLASGQVGALVLRGSPGSDRLEVLGAVARTLGHGLIEYRPAGSGTASDGEADGSPPTLLGPLCSLTDYWPVLTYDPAPGESIEPPPLTGYQGPLGILLGQEGGITGPLAEQALTLTLPSVDADLRRRCWQQVLGDQAGPDMAVISQRFRLPPGYIRRAGRLAVIQAALEGRPQVTLADARLASRTLNRQLLDSLAVRQDTRATWQQLVVNELTAAKLHELELRCRYREALSAQLGPAFGDGAGSGVRALLTGASGTGKTLAARILGSVLGMDLYRVDLSAVVNKYIGETEKNLHRVLSRAEELDVILLLDEGDALLGNRTEVKSANDRYANLETNFLLQRLESYQGIVLITTNAGQYIDQAFQRRMDVVVQFTAPQAEERLRIWRLHLPARHTLTPAYLATVAGRYALSGGQIRNAALHAALLAVDAASGTVGPAHLAAAIASEYRKAGALVLPLEQTPDDGQQAGMVAFLDLLARQRDAIPAATGQSG